MEAAAKVASAATLPPGDVAGAMSVAAYLADPLNGLATGEDIFRDPRLVAPWTALMAFLMISNVATLSWTLMRPRRDVRLGLIAVIGMVFAALLLEPWWTLVAICAVYLALIPYAWTRYARVKRQRAAVPASGPADASSVG